MKTVIHIVGARPNFIKASPIIKKIDELDVENLILHTGQHYDTNMSQQFFDDLNIPKPDWNLGFGGGSHASQTAMIMIGCEKIFMANNPDLVIVYGDVNSCFAGALVAQKMGIKVAHVESGLRSFDRRMPEETNRVLTDSISDILFLTSSEAIQNLKREGVDVNKCHLVGNTMIDSLVEFESTIENQSIGEDSILAKNDLEENDYVLITLHRPSNVDDPEVLKEMMDTIVKVSESTKCVFPMHPRTKNNLEKFDLYIDYIDIDSLKIIEPQGYLDFMCLQKHAKFIITDSGGIQEESSFFNVPCLTVRENTERPVTIDKGTNKLIGIDYKNILNEIKLIDYDKKSEIPLWDGEASDRIINIIKKELK